MPGLEEGFEGPAALGAPAFGGGRRAWTRGFAGLFRIGRRGFALGGGRGPPFGRPGGGALMLKTGRGMSVSLCISWPYGVLATKITQRDDLWQRNQLATE